MDHDVVLVKVSPWLSFALALLGIVSVCHEADAQVTGGRYPWQEYNERIRATELVAPLKSDLFGDQISLYDASAEFSVVDIDLPGNSSLPVELRRRLRVESKKEMEFFGGFGEWDIEVPYLYGVFTSTWKWNEAGNGSVGRCSEPWYPKISNYYELDEIWSGNYLHMPGEGDRLMLYLGNQRRPTPQDGAKYPWGARDFLSFSCKNDVSGGSGEGFVLVTPQGLRYTFDVMIEKSAGRLNKFGALIPRVKVFLAASRVEDRFGNWVEYRYSGAHLTEIAANDGRSIQIHYSGNNIGSVVANGRTWTYGYTTNTDNNQYKKDRLSTVVQPDGSSWKYDYSGTLSPQYSALDLGAGEQRICPESPHPLVAFSLQATHPSGAKGSFDFQLARHRRTGVMERSCIADSKPQTWRLATPNYFDVYSLRTKTISGPGMGLQQWRYSVQNPRGERVSIAKLPCTTCEESKTTQVTQPDGSKLTYRFGTLFYHNDGRLLGMDSSDAQGNLVRSETHTYVADNEVGGQPFPPTYGDSFGVDDASGAFIRPKKETVIHQDGESYVNTVDAFDALARPTRIIKSNSLNYGRYDLSEQFDYHDNHGRWVLGQLARHQQLTPRNIELTRTEFDAADLPARRYEHGRLLQDLSYAADGTVKAVSDALGNKVTALDWRRGTPQAIHFPDGSSEAAVVDANGWLTTLIGRNGTSTHYQYDPMGRLTRIQHPADDGVAWSDTLINFAPVNQDEYGISAGHWRQIVSTGNARKITYYDALWQPRIAEAFDVADRAATLSQVESRFDSMGRRSFESFATRGLTSVDQRLEGTRTYYDSLGRPVLQHQDSELGQLSTRTEYLSGGRIRSTNPRNYTTTVTYLARDQPSAELPVAINLPEGAFLDIERNSIGSPIAIRRRDAGAMTAVTRRYV